MSEANKLGQEGSLDLDALLLAAVTEGTLLCDDPINEDALSTHFVRPESRFTCSSGALSQIIAFMTDFIHDSWHHLLEFHHSQFPLLHLEQYAHATHTESCPFNDVVSFMDVKIHRISPPGDNQCINYNSYSKSHTYKYQAVLTPDGLITLCAGPMEGWRANVVVVQWSVLLEVWFEHARGYNNQPLLLYANPAYGKTDVVVSGLKKVWDLVENEQRFNTVMSKYRESVSNLWAFLKHVQQMKLHISPIRKYFQVAVLLTNAHSCQYGSDIAEYFQSKPPSLGEYFVWKM
ncbi:hypothetical protein JAAARDRAFT_61093 [Jaapia argillacea MUCL 33604]|uniref:DDE Tnp4 domain-containing protein n=1 Tax=Jaapia argillacea MUCL 33604 TaxID=933084 RepID=A0A067PIM8_9AGAM|nr:hypothetical protein JAAARDRAFT_61093 [Jaapia argillacea MUCL 33604]